MNQDQPDSRFPIVEPEPEVEADVWMNIAEAAEYGNMATSTIYQALKEGLKSRTNPKSNIKEVSKTALEIWFCPFKKNHRYENERVGQKMDKQQLRIRHLQSRITQFQSHIADLRDTVETLKNELEIAHDRENKLLEVIIGLGKE